MRAKKTKFLALLTATAMIAPVVVTAPAAASNIPYKDISPQQNAEIYEAVSALYDSGAVFGVTKTQYMPYQNLTRGEAAAFLARAAKMETKNVAAPKFQDVTTKHPYYKEIAALAAAGIVNNTTQFKPNDSITRSQMAKMIALTFKLPLATHITAPIKDFTPQAQTNTYIQTLFNYGITTPGDYYKPYNPVTRGHMALFMHRASKQASAEEIEIVKEASTVKGVTKSIEQQLANYERKIEVLYTGKWDDVDNNLKKMFRDAQKNIPYEAGHLTGTSQLSMNGHDGAVKITITVEYLTNAEQERAVTTKVNQVVANIKAQTTTDLQRIKAVNDYIVSTTAYSEDTNASPHSAYAALMEGKAVCQGYALLAHKMLSDLGIETQYTTGYVNGTEAHAWNLVKLDNQWYHLDTTWNDPLPNRHGTFTYDYFLVSDDQLGKDHTWQRADYPSATSNRFYYMQGMAHAYENNGQIYYANKQDDYKLYTVNLATGKSQMLLNNRAMYVTGNNGMLYFSAYNNGGYLTSYRIADGYTETLQRVHAQDLYIENNNLYYKVDGASFILPL